MSQCLLKCTSRELVHNNIYLPPVLIIHEIFWLTHFWSKHVKLLNAPAKTREYSTIIWNRCCKKHLKGHKHNYSLNLAHRYSCIFVLGHTTSCNVFLVHVAHSFDWAPVSENCSFLGTDDVHVQNSKCDFCTIWGLFVNLYNCTNGEDTKRENSN